MIHMLETEFEVGRLEIVMKGARWDRVEAEVRVQSDLVVPRLDCWKLLLREVWERSALSSMSLSSSTVLGRDWERGVVTHWWLGRRLTWK